MLRMSTEKQLCCKNQRKREETMKTHWLGCSWSILWKHKTIKSLCIQWIRWTSLTWFCRLLRKHWKRYLRSLILNLKSSKSFINPLKLKRTLKLLWNLERDLQHLIHQRVQWNSQMKINGYGISLKISGCSWLKGLNLSINTSRRLMNSRMFWEWIQMK